MRGFHPTYLASDPDWQGLQRIPQALPPNSILEQTQAAFECLYFPLGCPLLFQTNDRALLDGADAALQRFGHPECAADPVLTLRLMLHAPTESCCSSAPAPRWRTQGHLAYMAVGHDNTAVIDLARGYAFGFVTSQLLRDKDVFQRHFIEAIALSMACPVGQFIPLHSAGVIAHGSTVLLHGPGGAGKSTLAYACLRRGFQILAEDVVYLHAPSGRLWGVPWRLSLTPEAQTHFPDLRGISEACGANEESKLQIDPESAYPGSTVVSAATGILVSVARLEPHPLRSSTIELLPWTSPWAAPQCIWPWWVGWTTLMEERLNQMARWPAYRLRMSGSPEEAAAALDAWLARRGTR